MKSGIALAIAALFACGAAFAQDDPPQPRKAPARVAQASGGGPAAGAGEATGAAGTSLGPRAIIAIGVGAAVVLAASRSDDGGGSFSVVVHH